MTFKKTITYAITCEQVGCSSAGPSHIFTQELADDVARDILLGDVEKGHIDSWLVVGEKHYCPQHVRIDQGKVVPDVDPNPWMCSLCGRMSSPHHIGPLHSIATFELHAETLYAPRQHEAVSEDVDERLPMVIAADSQYRDRRR